MSRTTTTTKSVTKKWPSNPKYQNVKPVVDSGFTIRKYLESIEELHRNFKLNRDEIFRRIKLETFVRLIVEVWMAKLTPQLEADAQQQEHHNAVESIATPEMSEDSNSPTRSDALPTDRTMTSRSTLHSVISGIGELDLTKGSGCLQEPTTCALPELLLYKEQPYLLLDVRDVDTYGHCHILSALNYPHTMLSRVMNYETKELLSFKNKSGCIIVVYDEDETLSQKVAATLVQRGYDNIYLLSGGLNLAWQRFSDALITGSPYETGGRMNARSNLPTTSLQSGFTIHQLHRLEQKINVYLTNTSGPFRSNQSVSSTRRGQGKPSPTNATAGPSRQQDQRSRKPWK